GIAASKYVAKVASAHQKPDGLTIVPEGSARAWLAPLPVACLWGAGPKTQARLHALGYTTIGEIGRASIDQLQNQLGSLGRRFHQLANAEDPREVEGRRKHRSMGSERTLEVDVVDHDDIVSHLRRCAHRVARRLRTKGWHASGVRVRLKTSTFRSLTRQCKLAEPTDVADTLLAAGIELLNRFDHPGPYRLVGMATFDFSTVQTPQQLSLLDNEPQRRQLEVTLDALSQRYGDGIVVRAKDLSRNTVIDATPNLDFAADTSADTDIDAVVERDQDEFFEDEFDYGFDEH
ncbi:MAG: DNA polymerase Y family protein, partial [Pseudomonadales bacterium]